MNIRTLLLITLLSLTACGPLPGPKTPPPTPKPITERPSKPATKSMLLGLGDRARVVLNGRTLYTHDLARSRGAPVNATGIWLTHEWDDGWLNRDVLAKLHEDGIAPVIYLYYFGDRLSKEDVLAERDDWLDFLEDVADLVSGPYPVYLLLEPEINDEGARSRGRTPVLAWSGMDELLLEGIGLIRKRAANARVGICFGDFGRQDYERAFGDAIRASDFIAYQEMRGWTRHPHMEPSGGKLAKTTADTAAWLYKTWKKPVLLSYVALSTYTNAGGDAWNTLQAASLNAILKRLPAMQQSSKVFGFLYFMLLDDPAHVGWFGPAEKHFGLMDHHAKPKPAWWVFRRHTRKLQGRPDTPL